MRENHRPFALLYPYSIPLYRRLGWEIISNKMTYIVKDTQIPRKIQEPGYVRRVEWNDRQFMDLHTKFAQKTHGCLYRNKPCLGGILAPGTRDDTKGRDILLPARTSRTATWCTLSITTSCTSRR